MTTSLRKRNFREAVCWGLFSLLLSFAVVVGYNIEHFHVSSITSLKTWLVIFVLTIALFFPVSAFSYHFARKSDKQPDNRPAFLKAKSIFLFGIAVVFLAWLPIFLASYPGLFTYDAFTQTHYSIMTREVNSFHPLIHTYFMSWIIEVGKAIFGSYEAGVALHSLCQMFLMASIYSYISKEVGTLTKSSILQVFSLLFFAVNPISSILSISTTKDVLFSGILALLALELLKFTYRCDSFFNSKTNILLTILSIFFAGTLRNNAIYALLVISLPLFFIAKKSKRLLASLLTLALPLAAAWLFVGPITSAISNGGGTNSLEVLGVPIQQLASTYKYAHDLPEEDKQQIEQLIPDVENFNPYIVDPIKFAHKTNVTLVKRTDDLLSLWLRMGLRYPTLYFDELLTMTSGYWYPLSKYSALNTTKPYLEYDAWKFTEPQAATRFMGDHYEYFYVGNTRDSYIEIDSNPVGPFSKITPYIRHIAYCAPWIHNRITNLLTNAATYFWIFIFAVVHLIVHRKIKMIVSPLLIVIYIFSCFLGPVFLIRYAYPLSAALPIALTSITIKSRKER